MSLNPSRILFVAVGALMYGALTAAHAADLFAGPVVARGRGVEVRQGDLDDAFVAYKANMAARGEMIPENRRTAAEAQLLDRMVVTQLLVQKATPEDRARALTNAQNFIADSRAKADSEEAFVRNLKSLGLNLVEFTNRVVEQAISQAVVTRVVVDAITIPEEDMKQFYETNPARFHQSEMARASHILIATRDLRTGLPMSAEQKEARHAEALKILERARKEPDFEKLVVELSEEPNAKRTKGEYKFARARDNPRQAMVPEFEAAAFALQPGEVSDLVTTQFGYHIIKLHEIIPARQVPLEEVKDRVREHLVQVETEKRLPPYFATLKKEAGVEVLDDKLRAALERENTGAGAGPTP